MTWIIAALKFVWAWALPYAGPLLVWAGPKLARVAGLGAALGIPSGLALPVIAGGLIATTLAIGLGWMGWRHAREMRAETAFVNRCNGVILAANSRAMREALARAQASETAAAAARAEGELYRQRAAQAGDDLQEALRKARDAEAALAAVDKAGQPKPVKRAAGDVCLPADIMAKALGG